MDQHWSLPPEPPVLDVDELIRRCTGRLDLVERILAKFCGRFPLDLDALEQAVLAEDLGAVAQIAHRVKGASASVAAHTLRSLVAETEDHARRGRHADVSQCVGHLRQEWVRFQEHASDWNPCDKC